MASILPVMVLILIVVEYGLGACGLCYEDTLKILVLILIVVEYGLGVDRSSTPPFDDTKES